MKAIERQLLYVVSNVLLVEGCLLVSACVLIRTVSGKFDEAVKSLRQVKGVQRVFPVLGRYDVVADVEVKDPSDLGPTVLRLGRLAAVVFTETLVEIEH
jgi:DNA-binding Lrp family transcriptional regulator